MTHSPNGGADQHPPSSGPPAAPARERSSTEGMTDDGGASKAGLLGGLVAVLVVCLGFAAWFAIQARTELKESRAKLDQLQLQRSAERKELDATENRFLRESQARQDVEAALDFLSRALTWAPAAARGPESLQKEILDAAAARMAAGELGDRPEMVMRIRRTLGRAYAQIGRRQESINQYRIVLEAARKRRAKDDPALLLDLFALARVLASPGTADEGGRVPKEDADEARSLNEEAVLLYAHCLEQRPWGRIAYLNAIIESNVNQGRLDRAVGFLEYAVEILHRQFGDEHPHTLAYQVRLAAMLRRAGKIAKARALAAKTAEMIRDRTPANHPQLAWSLAVLGSVLLANKEPVEAEPIVRECLRIRRESLPAEDWRIGSAMSLLGQSLAAQGKHEEARPFLVEGLKLMDGADDVPSATLDEARKAVAAMSDAGGKKGEAEGSRRTSQ